MTQHSHVQSNNLVAVHFCRPSVHAGCESYSWELISIIKVYVNSLLRRKESYIAWESAIAKLEIEPIRWTKLHADFLPSRADASLVRLFCLAIIKFLKSASKSPLSFDLSIHHVNRTIQRRQESERNFLCFQPTICQHTDNDMRACVLSFSFSE